MGYGPAARACAATLCTLLLWPTRPARGEDVEVLRRELEHMKRQISEMQDTILRQEAMIRALEARTAAPAASGAGDEPSALDRALAEAEAAAAPPAPTEAPPPRPAGATALRLVDVSVDLLGAAGTSTARDGEIERLQGGAHDPRRRGFTLQQAELAFAAAVDPYFSAEAYVVATDDSLELEEAFLTTQRLPHGLQVEAGHFFTEFGRTNPRHPHEWEWLDQPVVNTRLFGGDGLRNPGVRLGWIAPLPWFSEVHLGAQHAGGETAASFLGEGAEGERIGGRPAIDRDVRDPGELLYLARWQHGLGLTDSASMTLGGSALFGPNASGPDARTRIHGADLVVKWRPARNFRGWPFLTWETEIAGRDFEVPAVSGRPALAADTLHDWGLYSQLLWGFRYGWAAGVRYEYATGSGESVGGRRADPLRDDRHRLAPLLSYRPTEFSRLRLQYNVDHADHLGDDAHAVWLGVEVLYGAHPAHRY